MADNDTPAINDTPANRINYLYRLIDTALTQVNNDASSFKRAASKDKFLHKFVRYTVTLLAIFAPAFVTWQALGGASEWKLLGALFAALAGGVATLQQVFNYGDSYGRNELTSLALRELYANNLFKLNYIRQQPDDALEKYRLLGEILLEVSQRHLEATRQHIENEVKSITSAAEIKPATQKEFNERFKS